MAPLGVWVRLLRENGVPPACWGKLLRILVPTTLAVPLRLFERLRFGGAVARTRIDKPPVFVIGAARSGTTHLHNLLSMDPQYGSISTLHAAVPTFFFTAGDRLKPLMTRFAPARRPMDNMQVSMDLPQEEDLAVANSSRFSSIYAISFPRRGQTYYDRYSFMQGLSDRELRQWERVYTHVLRQATRACGGRRLVLKSPANTGRIPHLLRMFPGARFVHIVRNPFLTYVSLRHTFRSLVPSHHLQSFTDETLGDLAMYIYRETMRTYHADRELIPRGRLTEVRFEELERDALPVLEGIYAELDLPGWETAEAHVRQYLEGISGYSKNRHAMAADDIARVERECAFVLETWGYGPPDAPGMAPGI